MQKKTHEEYINDLKNKNDNLDVIENYVNTNTKIIHLCKKHNVLFKIKPSSALNGAGCQLCKKEKFRNKKNISNEEFVNRLRKLSLKFEPLEDYIDMKTKIKFLCKKHNIIWLSTPDSIIHGHGCYKCGSDKMIAKNTKTHEKFIQELYAINPNIECLEKYNGALNVIKLKCKIDNSEWYNSPTQLLQGVGCPKCSHITHRTNESYIKEIANLHPHVEVIGKYVNMKTPILHKCKIHNYIYCVSPSSIFMTSGCRYCGYEKLSISQRKKHDDYVNQVYNINPKINVIENYIDSKIPILHKCLIDGMEWKAAPSNILSGSGCPKCNSSRGEREISNWLDKKGIKYEQQKRFKDCKNKRALPFDFYLPLHNMCIEFDGLQHTKPIDFFGGEYSYNKLVYNDNIKNQYCNNNNIKLLRISYNDNILDVLSKNIL